MEPTLLAEVLSGSEFWGDEVFGPALAAASFRDEDETVALADSTEYGLVTGLWTRDLSRAHRLARRI